MAGIGGGARRGSLQDDRANGARSHSSPRGRVAFEYAIVRCLKIFFLHVNSKFVSIFPPPNIYLSYLKNNIDEDFRSKLLDFQ